MLAKNGPLTAEVGGFVAVSMEHRRGVLLCCSGRGVKHLSGLTSRWREKVDFEPHNTLVMWWSRQHFKIVGKRPWSSSES